jgi:hypothetical protein
MSQVGCPPELQFFDGRGSMRTLADGLEKLQELQPNLGDRPIAIRTSPLRLPTGEMTAIVALIAPETSADLRWASSRIKVLSRTGLCSRRSPLPGNGISRPETKAAK